MQVPPLICSALMAALLLHCVTGETLKLYIRGVESSSGRCVSCNFALDTTEPHGPENQCKNVCEEGSQLQDAFRCLYHDEVLPRVCRVHSPMCLDSKRRKHFLNVHERNTCRASGVLHSTLREDSELSVSYESDGDIQLSCGEGFTLVEELWQDPKKANRIFPVPRCAPQNDAEQHIQK